VTGLNIRHTGERFQWSNETISKYFCHILNALSSPPFYTIYVCLPSTNAPTPDFIQCNPKFFPFWTDAIGAIDGSHI
ncbi:hypothetical protein K435DRAFT_581956, partial [Dendrothele bispora CBS 962.96]